MTTDTNELQGDRTDAVVCRLIAEELGLQPDTVKPGDALAADLGADDLDRIEIVMTVEDEFGIEISDAEMKPLATVADLIGLVNRKLTNIPKVPTA